jgi:hypothetical protein
MTAQTGLAAIPVRDLRDGGPLRHAIEARDRARALRDDCLAWFPPAARHIVPALDGVTRRWLRRSRSPYLAEIEAIAAALSFPGIWFLNGSYQWGCTSIARGDDAPWLARTLDWPFSGLGRHVEVARMTSAAGEFYNVTWPGFVGVLTAMAPGRFAAAINQAPLWRRTRHPYLRPYDIAANTITTWRVSHIPPDQLLRQVFETCVDFAEAKAQLEKVPVARPVIFTLAGCHAGEKCVIERTEEGSSTRTDNTGAANDWLVPTEPWEARVGGDLMFNANFAEAGENSRQRREVLAAWSDPFGADSFAWVTPPVLNPFTRIAAEMCPAKGILRLAGYEMMPGFAEPQAVTRICEIAASPAENRTPALAS